MSISYLFTSLPLWDVCDAGGIATNEEYATTATRLACATRDRETERLTWCPAGGGRASTAHIVRATALESMVVRA